MKRAVWLIDSTLKESLNTSFKSLSIDQIICTNMFKYFKIKYLIIYF